MGAKAGDKPGGSPPAPLTLPGLQFLAPSPFTVATSTEDIQAKVNQLCVIRGGGLGQYVALWPMPSLPRWLFSSLALHLAQCHNTGLPQLKASLQPSSHGVCGDLLGSRAGINAKLMQAGAGSCFGKTPQPENGPVIKAAKICLT